jgi:hypothetical protein
MSNVETRWDQRGVHSAGSHPTSAMTSDEAIGMLQGTGEVVEASRANSS